MSLILTVRIRIPERYREDYGDLRGNSEELGIMVLRALRDGEVFHVYTNEENEEEGE